MPEITEEKLREYESIASELKTLKVSYVEARTAQSELTAKKHELQTKIEQLTNELNTSKTELAKASGKPDEVIKQMQTNNEALANQVKALIAANKKANVDNKIIAKANELEAVNSEQVLTLISSKIAYNEVGEPFVSMDGKTPLIDANNKPYSIEGFTEKFLSENIHLKRSSGNNGAGSTGGRSNFTNNKFTPEDIKGMSLPEYEKNKGTILKQMSS